MQKSIVGFAISGLFILLSAGTSHAQIAYGSAGPATPGTTIDAQCMANMAGSNLYGNSQYAAADRQRLCEVSIAPVAPLYLNGTVPGAGPNGNPNDGRPYSIGPNSERIYSSTPASGVSGGSGPISIKSLQKTTIRLGDDPRTHSGHPLGVERILNSDGTWRASEISYTPPVVSIPTQTTDVPFILGPDGQRVYADGRIRSTSPLPADARPFIIGPNGQRVYSDGRP